MHVSNLEIMDVRKFLFDALDYSLFKGRLETIKVRKTKLLIASLG